MFPGFSPCDGSDQAGPNNTMTYFPHPLPERPAIHATAAARAVRPAFPRDILWNQPVFKAPALPIPDVALEPLPLRATRITRRAAARG